MSVTVQDCEGREIKIGTRVYFGGFGDQTGFVYAISDPDIVESIDGCGRERVTGLAVYLDIRMDKGDAWEQVRAGDITSYPPGPPETWDDEIEQTFEEPGDLEVIE